MTENHILDVLNNQLKSLQDKYNCSWQNRLVKRHSESEYSDLARITLVFTINGLKDFAEAVGWVFVMDVDTHGFITRLEAIGNKEN